MFWFNGRTVYYMKGVNNMAIKKYIGARYAPKFMGAWDKSSEYAALCVVYTNEQSYVSRKTVPANTEITNTEFWIKSADWNAQVMQYNQNVEQYQANVERYNQNVETYNANVDNYFDATIHAYNTKEEMVNDTAIQPKYTLITCGANAVGDGGGSLYKVASTTSATAVALKNGLFAVPFDFTLESDVGQYVGVADTTAVPIKPISTFSVTSPSKKNVNIQIPSNALGQTYVIHVYSQLDYHINITSDDSKITTISEDVDEHTNIIIITLAPAFPSSKKFWVVYGSTGGAFKAIKLTTNYSDITHGTIGAFEIASDLSFTTNSDADNGKIFLITNTDTNAHTIHFFTKKIDYLGQIKQDVSVPANTTYLFYIKTNAGDDAPGSVPIVKYIAMNNA